MLWFIIYIASLITSLVSAANAEEGVASQYGRDSGNRVACGGELDEGALTAAHRTLPCGTRVRVTNESNGQSVTVTINDRGPFVDGRVIDLTPAAANAIRMGGLAQVTLSKELVYLFSKVSAARHLQLVRSLPKWSRSALLIRDFTERFPFGGP